MKVKRKLSYRVYDNPDSKDALWYRKEGKRWEKYYTLKIIKTKNKHYDDNGIQHYVHVKTIRDDIRYCVHVKTIRNALQHASKILKNGGSPVIERHIKSKNKIKVQIIKNEY